MKGCDLHIHTNNSDGADDWQTVLRLAEAAGLACISITDHDNCEVYFQMANTKKYFSGKIIPGIEMQAYFKGLSIEILGYYFDPVKMRQLLSGLYLSFEQKNMLELKRFYEKCLSLGMIFPADIVQKYDPSTCHYAMEHLYNEIKDNPHNVKHIPDAESLEYYNIFFKRHISNPNSLFYVNESDIVPPVDRVFEVIREAGGKVVLPHVYQYEENTALVLHGLVDKLDGIECHYPSFTPAQREYLTKLCMEKNLIMTGGSDYHGAGRPGKVGELGLLGGDLPLINFH